MYVPSLYRVEYAGDLIHSMEPTISGLAVRRNNAVVEDLDACAAPLRPIVPFVEAVHDRIAIEVMRGCPGRCRFCQASFCRRPLRFRSPQRIIELARAQQAATAFDTIGLLSLSTADYPQLEELVVHGPEPGVAALGQLHEGKVPSGARPEEGRPAKTGALRCTDGGSAGQPSQAGGPSSANQKELFYDAFTETDPGPPARSGSDVTGEHGDRRRRGTGLQELV